jgi:hypothetical protein
VETRYNGYTVMTLDSVLDAQALALDMLAQNAELIELIYMLQLPIKRTVNIYTNSKYAFTTLHVHGEIYLSVYLFIYLEKDYFKKKRQIPSGDCVHLFWVGKRLSLPKERRSKKWPMLY